MVVSLIWGKLKKPAVTLSAPPFTEAMVPSREETNTVVPGWQAGSHGLFAGTMCTVSCGLVDL